MKRIISVLILMCMISGMMPTINAASTVTAELDIDKNVKLTIPANSINNSIVVWISRGSEDLWFNLYSKEEVSELDEVKIYIPEINFGDALTVKLTGGYNNTFTLNYDEALVFADFKKKFDACEEKLVIDLLMNYSSYMQGSTYLSRLVQLDGDKESVFLSSILNTQFDSFSTLAGKIDVAAAEAFAYVPPQGGSGNSSVGSVIAGGNSGGGNSGGGSGNNSSNKDSGSEDDSTEASDIVGSNITVEELIPGIGSQPKFDDIETVPWAVDSINMLVRLGVVSGVSQNSFEPNRNITRAEFVKMLYSMFDECEEMIESSFIDVSVNDWFSPYVISAYNIGLVSGNDNNEFMPNAAITRQDAVVIIWRAMNMYKKIPTVKKDYPAFEDVNEISEYAIEAVKELYARGVINGLSEIEFAPKGNCTRAMAAKMLAGIMEY